MQQAQRLGEEFRLESERVVKYMRTARIHLESP